MGADAVSPEADRTEGDVYVSRRGGELQARFDRGHGPRGQATGVPGEAVADESGRWRRRRLSSFPRVENEYAGPFEIRHISRDERHAMDERRAGDESVADGAGVGHL